jgi:hypothetical protein
VFGVALFGADAPASFGADTPVDWANDRLDGAATVTNPLMIKAPHTARMFMLALHVIGQRWSGGQQMYSRVFRPLRAKKI